MSSNLSLNLSDEYLESLVKSGLDRLLVSLDGVTEETYSKYRLRGNFQYVRENMLKLQTIKQRLGVNTPVVVWQFLVFKHNQHEIEFVKKNYQEWGADEFTLHGAQMPYEAYNTGFEPSDIPEYNLYHPDHIYTSKAKTTLADNKSTCSWLYGTVVINPNGKVSPCCAVADEKQDFGEYLPEKGFMEVWNSPKYQQARNLFPITLVPRNKKPSGNYEMVKGTAALAGVDSSKDELICHKCPIPFLQDDAVRMINLIAVDYWKLWEQTRQGKYLLALFCMGLPGLGEIASKKFPVFATLNYPRRMRRLQEIETEYKKLKKEYETVSEYAKHVEAEYQKAITQVAKLEGRNK